MDRAIVRKILFDCMKIDRVRYPASPIVSIAHDNDRSLLHNGKHYSPLIDTMEDDLAGLGIHCLSVARIISAIKGDLAYGNVVSPEGRFARALVQKRLSALLNRGRYPYSSMEERAWGSVLDRTGARKVFGILPSRELCVACHKRGVWVADVQHGVIADTHPWYGEAFRSVDPPSQVPDAFLCWDPGSAEVIGKWAHAKGSVTRTIGNRWLARFVAPTADDSLVRELTAKFARPSPADGRKTILLALSWGEVDIPNRFVADGLEAAIKKTAQRFRWLIRLHPNQLKGFATDEGPQFFDYFEKQLKGCAEWEFATHAPLPLVLREVDLHVSWWSSVCIEAAQMGIRSALLSPRLRDENVDYYTYYRNAGLIDLIDEAEPSIVDWIERNLDSKRTPETFLSFDAEYRDVLTFLAAANR